MTGIRRVGVVLIGVALAASVFPVSLLIADRSIGSMWLWIGLIAAFAVAEHAAIHIPLRRSAHTLPLDELPFVIGLVFVPPIGLLTARLIGSAIGVLTDRGTTMPRRAYGVAQYGAGAAVGIVVADLIAKRTDDFSPIEWAAVAGGTLTSSLVGLVAVLAAISLSEGIPSRRDFAHELLSSTAVTTVNTSVGLLAAFIALTDVRALVLLVPIAIFSVAGYHAYVSAHRHRSQLELVTEMLRGVAIADGPESALAGLLQRTAGELHASTATTIMLSADSETPSWRVVANDGAVAVTALHLSDADSLRKQLAANHEHAYRSLSEVDSVGPALVARLDGEQGVVGLLAVSGRHEAAGPFTRSDQTLLEAVALQAGAVIERTRVERLLSTASERHEQLLYEANHDPLTRLANRRLFVAELEQSAGSDTPASVLLIDLDDFKPINDEYGHTVGDELLCRVADRLRNTIAAADLVARLGGDEFAVLRQGAAPMTEWRALAENLARVLGEPYLTSVGVITISASVGAASSEPGLSGARLLAKADRSMYEAKRGTAPRRGQR